MAEIVVVEAKLVARVGTTAGRSVDVTGVFAVDRDRIAATLRAAPRRITVLDRGPTDDEMAAARSRGLIGDSNPDATPKEGAEATRATEDSAALEVSATLTANASAEEPVYLTDLNRDELLVTVEALGLPAKGNMPTLIKSIRDLAAEKGVESEDVNEIVAGILAKESTE
ncbi:MAG: hypothetical protein H0U69_03695 [Trueperaceae bacterium]|nr:hypothetical protein [Trueperaceae bacterium]